MRVLAALIVLFASPFLLAQDGHEKVDHVIVYKLERKLVLLSKGKEVRSYKIALGGQPVGPKTRQGDHRTPEGSYVIDSRNVNSQFHRSLHISYPQRKRSRARTEIGNTDRW